MSEIVLEKNNKNVPVGWELVSLDKIIQNHDGKRIPISAEKRKSMKGKYPYYGASGIIDYVNKPIFNGKFLLIGEDGANLLSRSTPIAFIASGEFWVNNHAHVLSTYGSIPLEFLAFYINSIDLSPWVTGTAQPKLNQRNMNKIPVPTPPLQEQKRIVSKIEEFFSILDRNSLLLTNTLSHLNLFFISFLKNIFEGKLTNNWRNENPALQPVHVLLEKKRLEISKNKKSEAKKHEIDKSLLPPLPKEWDWTQFDEVCDNSINAIKAGPFGSSLKKEFYVSSGYKIYGQEQVIRGDPDYGDYYIDENRFRALQSCEVKPRDLLISLVGTIGKTLVLPNKIKKGIINPRLIKITVDRKLIDPGYVQIYFQSSIAKSYFKISSHGGTMDILNMSILKKLPIPLPPLSEQMKIIELREQELSLINNIELQIKYIQNKIQIIRNKILQTAFDGKLVSQNPNDEPAEVLLQKIKQEKQKIISQAPKKRGRKNVK